MAEAGARAGSSPFPRCGAGRPPDPMTDTTDTRADRQIVADTRYTGWSRPGGWQIVSLSRCRGCGQPIAWARTFAGRSAPLDRDGVNHFATCPDADRFRKRSRIP